MSVAGAAVGELFEQAEARRLKAAAVAETEVDAAQAEAKAPATPPGEKTEKD